jgi:glycosyltransferase involved in cell wall biosynthesis
VKLLHLTAGTGSFHCGTCIRDNTFVGALGRLGHEAALVPLYLPLVVDGEDCSVGQPLFLGGINTYLQQSSALFRRAPRWVNRLLDARPLLHSVTKLSSMTNPAGLGALTVSMVKGLEGFQADEIRRLAHWIRDDFKPDVVVMSNGLLAGIGAGIKEIAGVKVVCTLQSELHFVDGLAEPHRAEVWTKMGEALGSMDAIIAVSDYCREQMIERIGLDPERVQVVHAGLDLRRFEPSEAGPPESPVLGYFARISEEKGAMRAVRVFDELRSRPGLGRLKLDIGGSVAPGDWDFVKRLEKASESPFAIRIAPNVSLEQKQEFMRGVSVLFVPGREYEIAGLYALEAMASGVPVVAGDLGGPGELVNATGGGLLYRAGDREGMLDTLERLLKNRDLQIQLGAAGREAALRDYSAEAMAKRWLDNSPADSLCSRYVR